MTQQMLAIWSLVPLPFLNPAWTSGSSWFMYCWSLAAEFWDYFARVWDECNCVVVWTSFGIAFIWDWNETELFQSWSHCWVFQTCWHIKCRTLTASYFRIWNSSTGIPSPPPAFFIVMLPNIHLTSHSRMSGSRWMITKNWGRLGYDSYLKQV